MKKEMLFLYHTQQYITSSSWTNSYSQHIVKEVHFFHLPINTKQNTPPIKIKKNIPQTMFIKAEGPFDLNNFFKG